MRHENNVRKMIWCSSEAKLSVYIIFLNLQKSNRVEQKNDPVLFLSFYNYEIQTDNLVFQINNLK